jgi:hypothetical protein
VISYSPTGSITLTNHSPGLLNLLLDPKMITENGKDTAKALN